MKQVITSGTNNALNTLATEYNSIWGRTNPQWNATEANRIQLCPGNGIIHSFKVKASAAPSAGSYTFTIRQDTGGGMADTSITATISKTSNQASDDVNVLTVSAGDLLSLKCVPNSVTGTPQVSWSFIYEDSDGTGRAIYIGGGDGSIVAGAPDYYNQISGGGGWLSGLGIGASWGTPSARTGTLKDLYIDLTASPGVGDAWQFDVTGGGLSVIITSTATTGSDTSGSQSIAIGDDISIIAIDRAGAPTTTQVRWGCVYESDDDDEWIYGGWTDNTLHSTSTEYNYLNASDTNWNGTRTNREILTQSGMLTGLRVELGGSPGTGNSYTFTIMINGVNTNLSTTISDTSAVGTIDSEVVVNDFDKLTIKCVPSGGPTVRVARWGIAFRTFQPQIKLMGVGL